MIVSTSSLKGGVGKSTISIFLANALAKKNKVLVIDMDPQSSVTDYYAPEISPDDLFTASFYNKLQSNFTADNLIENAIAYNDNLSLIPATPELHNINHQYINDLRIFTRTDKVLSEMKDYFDFIIIDTPPSLSLPFFLTLHITDYNIIPVNYDRWVLSGFFMMMSKINESAEARNVNIPTKVIGSMCTQKEFELLKPLFESIDGFDDSLFIPRSASVRTAIWKGKTLPTRLDVIFDSLADKFVNV